MASQPGILTDWPWKPLGSFKHMTLAPWVVHTIYSLTTSYERDLVYYLILPMLMARIVHSQIWISVSRHRTAQGKNRIVDRGLEFSQVDRETNWDDNILLTGHIMYIVYIILPEIFHHLPLWRTEGVILMVLLHAGPVEFLYYWLHKALHHHFLYSRYHSHHHSSIVTQPITAVAHPFAEVLAYITLFAIPLFVTLFTKTASGASVYGYLFYIDFMNNLGHCNFEFFPKKLFSLFPFLKYLTYTPSFHSLHHTRFRTNYCLFMPIYDYIYGTVDESTDETYETSLKRPNDSPNVVHLTHLTTLDSIYHLPLGFASLASKPQTSKWYLHFMWPFTFGFIPLAWIFGRTFVSERNTFKKLNLQSWVIPRFTKHYLKGKSTSLNKLIEEAILEAESSGAKVLSLGLLNQEEELNEYGQLYIHKFPELKMKVVDGSSLAAAIVVNSIPKSTSQVFLRGNFNKVSLAISNALSKRNVQVAILYKDKLTKLHSRVLKSKVSLTLTTNYDAKIWLVGDGWDEDEQMKASKGTLFIPYSQFPPKKMRKDCFYHCTPAMMAPLSFTNAHACENWLPRRAMSAWRIAGIVHALEEWNVHECGSTIFNINQIWHASIRHGFQPLDIPF
ncbi:very-long-chain aldehyde decarbonylase CER1-like isoform X1 [Prosopis cineraria]|uniref:very-long-chain aldehyde decarbonylase CER1-like isoform X1 n=1 Tax=Prosopis cineraria TaxID=364024 RepID=UPI002410B648|nr:very-long-chain aldehyde decarbonylase CER1-like isoform X1 [Prosopis cineraria]